MKPADLKFRCSTFTDKLDVRPRFHSMPWSRMVESFTRHAERADKDGPLWSPAIYKNGASRDNEGVESLTAAVGDFDSGIGYDELQDRLLPYEHVVHSTFNHSLDHPKFRVILPFCRAVPAEDWPDIRARINEHIFGLATDAGTKDTARMYYTPSCPPGTPRFTRYVEAELLDPHTLPPVSLACRGNGAAPQTGDNKKAGKLTVVLGRAALEFVANGAPIGEQRSRALAAARNYLSAGYSVEATANAVWRGLQASPQEQDRGPWQWEDAQYIASDLAQKAAPPLDISPLALPPEFRVERVGLGYVFAFPTEGIMVTIDHLRRGREGLGAEILIECAIAGLPRHIHWARLNMASSTARGTLERTLESRTKGALIRWDGILETVCREVAVVERQGEPFEYVGDLPTTHQGTWLVRNLAVAGETTTIFGEGGTGKSNLALAIALSVQTGQTFAPGFPPLRQGNVLVLDWETTRERIDARIKALCAGIGMPATRIRYRRCVAGLVDQIEEVLRECQAHSIAMVVVDSVEMATTDGRENGDANDAIKRLYTSLRYLNTTCLLIDHVSAASVKEKGTRKPYGGIFKVNLCRLAFDLQKGQEGDGKIHLALYNTKRNDDGTLLPAAGFRVEFDAGTARYYGEEITDPELIAGLKGPDRVQQALSEGALTVAEIVEATGLEANNVYRICNRGKGQGIYKQVGKKWELAEKF